ncbi:menaquinone biosynthetic enzyme MqnA/MqnD family protein [Puia sp. P3]|uniref:menaquinone biosynthetic enzyme MqnA/MqnD family protein n=1 Tax=Puia sp. P3 TaxID=3423952 RepID=UPI003D66DFEA
MDQKIRVGAVNYLNTKPLLYGIDRSPLRKEIDLIIDYPASIANMLLRDQIDIGLVPVAVIPYMEEYYINGAHCIGSDGDVASVCLFSETPIEKVEKVLLDYQSRTSVQLARILLKEYWQVSPEVEDAGKDFRDHIKGTTAGVVIGDRALMQRKLSPYIYDLGGSWKAFTGLPFVFAAWVSNKPLDPGFIREFDQANKMGLGHIDEVVAENPFPHFDLHAYFTKYLDYELDSPKKEGLELFLHYLRSDVNNVKKEYFRPS